MEAYVSTSTVLAGNIVITFFNGYLNLLTQILPYAIGLLILFIGWNIGRRALSGR